MNQRQRIYVNELNSRFGRVAFWSDIIVTDSETGKTYFLTSEPIREKTGFIRRYMHYIEPA